MLPVHVVVEGDTVILGSNVVEGADEPGFVSCYPGPGCLDEHVITCRARGKGGERHCSSLPESDGMPEAGTPLLLSETWPCSPHQLCTHCDPSHRHLQDVCSASPLQYLGEQDLGWMPADTL